MADVVDIPREEILKMRIRNLEGSVRALKCLKQRYSHGQFQDHKDNYEHERTNPF